MQLSGPEILQRMKLLNPRNPNGKPNITIEPFDERCLGSNSYDLHLSPTLKVYECTIPYGMLPALKYVPGRQYSMEDWFNSDLCNFGFRCDCSFLKRKDNYQNYLKGSPEYDFRNPKFLLDPTKSNKTIDIKIPETGLILNPALGYLGSTVEYTETYNYFPYIDGKSSIGRNFILNHHTAGRGDDGFCGTWTLEIRTLHPTVIYPYMRIGQIYYEEFTGEQKQYNKNSASHYNGQIGPTPAAPVPVDLFIRDLVEKQQKTR